MNVRPGRSSPPMRRPTIAAVALLVALSVLPFGAAAEIPHENYDLASSDLDTVVALLNSSIRSSEWSLRALADQDTVLADQYLDRVGAVLGPAEDILSEIEDVAGSYEELSGLLPPFTSLYGSEETFLALAVELLDAKGDIISSSELLNLTDEQLVDAIDAIARFNSLIDRMNSTIDQMLVHALEIDALTVDGATPFVPNELVELIEQLRESLVRILEDMQKDIDDGIPWDEDVSFLLLWITDPTLHLGDTMVGGGYLFLNGSFAAGMDVDVSMDGTPLLRVTTGSDGKYGFSRFIPLNESWLGSHSVASHASADGWAIDSEPVTVTISLVPTRLLLTADTGLVSAEERVAVKATLRDVRSTPVPGMNCTLTLDGEQQAFVTDDDGGAEWSWSGLWLGYGTHTASASYEGVLPYASSSSGTVTIIVDIPTNVTLNLFSDRLKEGYHLIGDGSLTSNVSDPMPNRYLSLYVDGEHIQDVRTDEDGVFAYSIGIENMSAGTHVLRAAFELREDVWRYSEAEASFVIVAQSYMDYPFFPWIPGWDIGFSDQIPYLFFGENAYYTWMFIILVIGIVVKAFQVRKARRAEKALEAPPSEDALEEGAGTEPQEARDWSPERAPEWLTGPNEKVVWHYARMISFLRRRRRVGITDNMTHWEVARLLQSLGYPETTTTRVTVLFEKAYYSGATLSEADVIQMGSSAHTIKRTGGARAAG